ncbi:hypothetical protein PEX1_086520 [Penicillium expansum]|nr:hypothetical protein PEX1_086520 [Penicillium expansum]
MKCASATGFVWVELAFRSLKELGSARKTYDITIGIMKIPIIPAWIHGPIQPWLLKPLIGFYKSSAIMEDEKEIIPRQTGPALEVIEDLYHGSKKEPDLGQSEKYQRIWIQIRGIGLAMQLP